MISDEQIEEAMDGRFDGIECVTIVQELLELEEQLKAKDKALASIWYFIKDDFPRGTGTDHGTCATEPYRMAARLVEQCVKGGA